MSVRTRIAPSPTGKPHIGTLYQALFDYAYAKKHLGQFIVRIEDTDQARFVEGSEEALYEALDWLGIQEDESPRQDGDFGPYKQSQRLEIYQEHAHKLVEKGYAYYCFCSKERLEEVRKEQQAHKQVPMYDRHCLNLTKEEIDQRIADNETKVIRMKIPRGEDITVRDGIRGDITFNGDDIDDQVILKSDGFPTYHLAVVVDDHLMNISHVVRGEEWISSLPKHVLLYSWFDWEMPEHFHTALLRNPDKSKMGKRHGHTNIDWYKEHGILPEALRNFMALLGWSHPDEEEIFNLDEFVDTFELKDLKSVGPVFDLRKLEWLNGEYIRMMSEEDVVERVRAYVEKYIDADYALDLIQQTVPLIQTRIKTLKEYDDYCRFFIEAPTSYEKDISDNAELIQQIIDVLENIDEADWKADVIGEKLQALAQKNDIGFGKFFMIIRVALSGKKITPPSNESMEILGKEECIARLENV